MNCIIPTLALLACGFGATARETNPMLGSWDWNPVRGTCHEVHTYRADGTAETRSGGEILQKTYAVAPAGGTMYVVTATVVSGNGGLDCLGAMTRVGATSVVYIQPLNDGGQFTCASEDGMSCYGNARRIEAAAGATP
ncbi:MAG: hypothetical protein EOP93_19385 [Lysobacteraceae bacterium]|nr:MAG: hypothetical protein EOP93_19385 [Xanthomonadaceae bacterium]